MAKIILLVHVYEVNKRWNDVNLLPTKTGDDTKYAANAWFKKTLEWPREPNVGEVITVEIMDAQHENNLQWRAKREVRPIISGSVTVKSVRWDPAAGAWEALAEFEAKDETHLLHFIDQLENVYKMAAISRAA